MLTLSTALILSSFFLSPLSNSDHQQRSVRQADQRVTFDLRNESHSFHDLKIDGHLYTVLPDQGLYIKAPIGTVIYAGSRFGIFRPGDVLLTVSSSLQDSRVELR